MQASDWQTLYEDRALLAINKPPGVLVESAGGDEESLCDRVRVLFGATCLPLHRLDRDTTGVTLFCKGPSLRREMAELFEKRQARKEYWIWVEGLWPRGLNRIDAPLEPQGGGKWRVAETGGGKAARTTFRVLAQGMSRSWLQALPKTGRTHQIRLHCLLAGHPIVGDLKYGGFATREGLGLHARSLRFRHPASGKDIDIVAPAPACWKRWLEAEGIGASETGQPIE